MLTNWPFQPLFWTAGSHPAIPQHPHIRGHLTRTAKTAKRDQGKEQAGGNTHVDYHCVWTRALPKGAIPGSPHRHCWLPGSNLFWSCQEGLKLFRISFCSTYEPCAHPHASTHRYILPAVYHLPAKSAWLLPLPSTNTWNHRHKSPSQPLRHHSPGALPLLRRFPKGTEGREGSAAGPHHGRGRRPHHLPATLEGLSLCRSGWCCHHPRTSPFQACGKRKTKQKHVKTRWRHS